MDEKTLENDGTREIKASDSQVGHESQSPGKVLLLPKPTENRDDPLVC